MNFLNLWKNPKASLSKFQPSKTEHRTEPVIGWRAWALKGNRLCSITVGTEWPTYQPMKALDPNWHLDIHGPNGIHAIKTLRELLSYGYAAPYPHPDKKIVGCISMWGLVIEGPIGYRSEYAYPLKFVLNPEEDILTTMMLEEEYGVPVEFSEMIPQARKGDEQDAAAMIQAVSGLSSLTLGMAAQTPMTATSFQQLQHQQNQMLMQWLAMSPSPQSNDSFVSGLISGIFNIGK